MQGRLCGAPNKNTRNIGKSNSFLVASAKVEMRPKRMGQNEAETYLWTIGVPMALHTNQCLISRGTKDNGGTNQLLSPAQSKQMHLPAHSQDSRNEKSIKVIFCLWEWVKRSTECGPQMLSTWCMVRTILKRS